jgi:hypothetical protein
MKKLIAFCSLALILSASISCKKVNEATEFDFNYSSDVSVPSSSISVTAPAEFVTPEIATESASRFSSEKTTQDLIEEIKVSKFEIVNTTGNLDFLKSFSVYIRGNGLSDVLVASKSSIPPGSTSVQADLTGANIKEHIFKDKIQFRISVTANSLIQSEQKLKVNETVHVSGKKIK